MKISAKKIAVTALLTALSMLLGIVESLLPPIIPALPFVRIGLGNAVIGFTVIVLGTPYALTVSLIKSVTVPLIVGNPVMAIYSLTGGLISAVVTAVLINAEKLSLPVIGIISSIAHNLSQITVAAIMTSTAAVFSLAVPLLLFGAAAGFGTGTIQFLLIKTLPEKYLHL